MSEQPNEDDTRNNARLRSINADLLDSLQTAVRWLRRLERDYPGCLNDDAIAKHLMPAIFKATNKE